MKKIFILIVILIALLFTACDILAEGLNILLEESESQESGDKPQDIAVSESTEAALNAADAPVLADIDYTGMDFFEDGYEIVTYYRTTDGDTASFYMDGTNIKCRFVGVNTPELDHDKGNHEPFAEDARDATQRILENAETIILERDDNAGTHDNYDRLLAHVWVDGVLLNYYLVYEGLATTRYVRSNYLHADDYFAAEEIEQDEGRGMWSN